MKNYFDGKRNAVKIARSVWVGGKVGDNIKDLPIDISSIRSSRISNGIPNEILSSGIYSGYA